MDYYATINEKGQITLPAKLRQKLNLEVGKKVTLSLQEDNNILIHAPVDLAWLRGEIKAHMKKNKQSTFREEDIAEATQKAAIKRYKGALDES